MEQKKEDIYLSPEDSYSLYKMFYEVSQLLEKMELFIGLLGEHF